jgi:hypothetical protein
MLANRRGYIYFLLGAFFKKRSFWPIYQTDRASKSCLRHPNNMITCMILCFGEMSNFSANLFMDLEPMTV